MSKRRADEDSNVPWHELRPNKQTRLLFANSSDEDDDYSSDARHEMTVKHTIVESNEIIDGTDEQIDAEDYGEFIEGIRETQMLSGKD